MGFGNHNSRIKVKLPPVQVTNVLDFDYQVTIIVAIEQQEKTPPDNHSGMAIDRQRMVRNWVYKNLKIPD